MGNSLFTRLDQLSQEILRPTAVPEADATVPEGAVVSAPPEAVSAPPETVVTVPEADVSAPPETVVTVPEADATVPEAEAAAPEAEAAAPEAEAAAPEAEAAAPEADKKCWICCREPWFTHIFEGRKTVEGRVATPYWQNVAAKCNKIIYVAVDDVNKQSITVRITEVKHYTGHGALRRYLENETLDRALPGIESIEAGEAILLREFPFNEIDICGILGFQIAVERG